MLCKWSLIHRTICIMWHSPGLYTWTNIVHNLYKRFSQMSTTYNAWYVCHSIAMFANFHYRTRAKIRTIVVVVSCAFWGKVFKALFFVAESMYVSPQHVSFKCISNHFRGLKLKNFPGECAPAPPTLVVSLQCVQSEPPQ